MSEENPEEQEAEEASENIVGYTEDLGNLGPDMVDQADVVLYAEDPSDSLGDLDEEISAELENFKEEAVEVSGETYIFDDFSEEIEISDFELLDQDVDVGDFYKDEELEEIADQLSGYNGIGSNIPFLGSALEWLFGSDYEEEDLDLNLLEEKGYTNEAHEEYLETQEAYTQVKSRIERAGDEVIMFGEENPINAKLNEDYDDLEVIPKDRIEGYTEFAEEGEGGQDEDEGGDSAEGMFSPERLAEIAGMAGGVDELYDDIEDDLPEPAYDRVEEMRSEVEEIYEEKYQEEDDQSAEEAPA